MAGRTCQPCKEVRASIETRFPSKKLIVQNTRSGPGLIKKKRKTKYNFNNF